MLKKKKERKKQNPQCIWSVEVFSIPISMLLKVLYKLIITFDNYILTLTCEPNTPVTIFSNLYET